MTTTIVRSYTVTLRPGGDIADRFGDEADADLAHEPVVVNLSYDEERAGQIDRASARAIAEATKRAITLERRTHPSDVELVAVDVEFTREKLVTR